MITYMTIKNYIKTLLIGLIGFLITAVCILFFKKEAGAILFVFLGSLIIFLIAISAVMIKSIALTNPNLKELSKYYLYQFILLFYFYLIILTLSENSLRRETIYLAVLIWGIYILLLSIFSIIHYFYLCLRKIINDSNKKFGIFFMLVNFIIIIFTFLILQILVRPWFSGFYGF